MEVFTWFLYLEFCFLLWVDFINNQGMLERISILTFLLFSHKKLQASLYLMTFLSESL